MGDFDDEEERWWQPMQSLWKLDDSAWVADRLELWHCIKNNAYFQMIREMGNEQGSENDNERKLRGIENVFMRGQTFEKKYTSQSGYWDADSADEYDSVRMRASDRVAYMPFESMEQMEKYFDCLEERSNGLGGAGSINLLRKSRIIATVYHGTPLVNEKVQMLSSFLTRGGVVDEYPHVEYSKSSVLGCLNFDFRSYVESLGVYFSYSKKTDPYGLKESDYLIELFDYFKNISIRLCEFDENEFVVPALAIDPGETDIIKIRDSKVDNRKRDKKRYSKIFNSFSFENSEKQEDGRKKEFHRKISDFVNSDNIPSYYKSMINQKKE